MTRAVRLALVILMLLGAACDSSSDTTSGLGAEAPTGAPDVMTTSSVPAFPTPTTTTTAEAPPVSTTSTTSTTSGERPTGPRPSSTDCDATPGALQARLDATPDGQAIADMWGKLVNAASLGFTVLDMSRECYVNQGTVTLDDRYGLWIVRPTTTGTDWVLADTSDTVISGLSFGDGSLTITGGNQRIEAGQVHDLTVSGATDFMMGKMVITGHAVFEDMAKAGIGASFARNSEFNTVEVTGLMDGFKILNSTAAVLTDDTVPGSDLNISDLVIR